MSAPAPGRLIDTLLLFSIVAAAVVAVAYFRMPEVERGLQLLASKTLEWAVSED